MGTLQRPGTETTINGLVNGDRMSQEEFHRRYEAREDDVKFELIGGTVFVASPLGWLNGSYHTTTSFLLRHYVLKTPGTGVGDNVTTILSEEAELQPDLVLRIAEESGGQSRLNERGHVVGAPELIVEITHSTRAIDLHQKLDAYEESGAKEYLVVCLEDEEVRWHDFTKNKMIPPNKDGVMRSIAFPGLWIDEQALLADDAAKLMDVLDDGTSSSEHAKFVQRLERQRRGKPRSK